MSGEQLESPSYYNAVITERLLKSCDVDGKEMMAVILPTIQDCLENLYQDAHYLPYDYWNDRITQACLEFLDNDTVRVYTQIVHHGNMLFVLVDELPNSVKEVHLHNRPSTVIH